MESPLCFGSFDFLPAGNAAIISMFGWRRDTEQTLFPSASRFVCCSVMTARAAKPLAGSTRVRRLKPMERIPTTREGYDKMREEIRHLDDVEMPKIAEKIADARAEGDLSENAEY